MNPRSSLFVARTQAKNTRMRRPVFELLERRVCLTFTWSGDASNLTLTGTENADTLWDIFIDNATLKIHYQDESGTHNTGLWKPTAQAPISISIRGLGGNDFVGLHYTDLGGFATDSVASLEFLGGAGDDEFHTPDYTEARSPVVWPSAEVAPFCNIIFAGDIGKDKMFGHKYPEYIDGGWDRDEAEGGAGNDWLRGGAGTDKLLGGAGNDLIEGNAGVDAPLDGGDGDDTIYGGADSDLMRGGIGSDHIYGGDGDDHIEGGPDDDYLYGEGDNDQINGDEGNDEIHTGPSAVATDGEIDFPGGPYWEGAWGDDGDDLIYANEAGGACGLDGGPDVAGGSDRDRVDGSAFGDYILGGLDSDTLLGFGGVDTIHGNEGGDDIHGGDGDDKLYGDADGDVIWGDEGNDEFHGGTQDDVLWSGYGEFGSPDQPWNGIAPPGVNATWRDMKGTGEQDCDLEDGHEDMDPGCPPPGAAGDAFDAGSNGWSPPLQVDAPGVLANDYYADAVELVPDTGPNHGSLTLNANGSLLYSPTLGYNGSDAFQYRAIDTASGKKSSPATVTISVLYMSPGAMDDAFDFTSDNGGYLDVPAPGVLGNDSYADQVELVPDSGPNSGSLTLGSNGSLLYTPTPGSSYVDSFQYIAIDSYTGIESQPATVTITVTCMYCSPLMLDQPAIAPGARALEMSQLSPLSRAAVERWRSAGVDDATIEARLAGLSFVILDLPGSQLGSVTAGGTIVIDSDAAGYGWFVDATPSDDREFQRIVSSSQKEANGGAAARAADLLTVLVHEIGHVLGLDHGQGDETNVMTDTLGLGMRRNPTVWDAAIVDYLYWQSQRRR